MPATQGEGASSSSNPPPAALYGGAGTTAARGAAAGPALSVSVTDQEGKTTTLLDDSITTSGDITPPATMPSGQIPRPRQVVDRE